MKISEIIKQRKNGNGSFRPICLGCNNQIKPSVSKDEWRFYGFYSSGKVDTRRWGYDTLFYCEDCKSKVKIKTPKKYSTVEILEDDVNKVKARYQYGNTDLKIENWLTCHWSNKGRFIVIKGKRVYL